MTLYLWHMPALLLMHLTFAHFGCHRYPGEPDLLWLSIIQLLLMTCLVTALFVVLRPLEGRPLPGWDMPVSASPGLGSAVTGVLVCVAGVAILASVKWGLKDDGIYCVAIMLTALLASRMVSRPVSVRIAAD
jgi:hypothetical protein